MEIEKREEEETFQSEVWNFGGGWKTAVDVNVID
jgi:hypothetical protein